MTDHPPSHPTSGSSDPGAHSTADRSGFKRGRLLAAGLLFGILVMALLGSFFWLSLQTETPFKAFSEEERLVLIPRGTSVSKIGDLLEAEGVIRSALLFNWYVRFRYHPPSLKAGEYRFADARSLREVAEMLHEGRVHYYRVTVPEGLFMEEMAGLFVAAGFGTTEGFAVQMRNVELVREFDPQASNLEGYLFPETYLLVRHMTEPDIIRAMVGNFRALWSQEFQERARQLNLSARQVVTLASLIEKETGLESERPLVSAVFHNRLRQNIPLGCDPTIIYAVRLVAEYDGVIHQSDLKLDSPYNTYLYPGLPPGPIANPGLSSIRAALFPADVDFLYFVSRNDGSHVFSSTYPDHLRAVARFQRGASRE